MTPKTLSMSSHYGRVILHLIPGRLYILFRNEKVDTWINIKEISVSLNYRKHNLYYLIYKSDP